MYAFPLYFQMLTLSLVLEIIREYFEYLVNNPSEDHKKMMEIRQNKLTEIKQIKSVQQEFVQHSLLSRRLIKIEKELESFRG